MFEVEKVQCIGKLVVYVVGVYIGIYVCIYVYFCIDIKVESIQVYCFEDDGELVEDYKAQ